MKERLLLRADASTQIGAGRIMRCLALAAALRAQGAECHVQLPRTLINRMQKIAKIGMF